MPVALYQRCQPNRAWVLCMLMLLSLVSNAAHAEVGCSAGFACGGLTGSLPALQDAQFTYQGSLFDLGEPANGRFDLRLTAYAQQQLGTTLASPITFNAVEVKDGRFRIDLDLPAASDAVWLGVEVRPAGDGVFSAIGGRSKAIAAPLVGQCWSTTGDSGSSSANFIGTIDAQPFVVRTQNVQSLRIEPSTTLFNGIPITSNTIAGSRSNDVFTGARGATIAGGGVPNGDTDPLYDDEGPNRVTDHYGTVSGGYANRAGDSLGTLADRSFATVGGGIDNTASGANSVVGGGQSNSAIGLSSTVSGGVNGSASGTYSTVGGGSRNTASALSSTVGGGFENCAGGSYSWAGGSHAKVRPGSGSGATGIGCSGIIQSGTTGDQGTFVWADSQGPDFISTGDNQFLVRAEGGIYLGTTSTVSLPSTRFINTSTGAFLSSGGSWTNASSRALKTDFVAINPGDVLDRVTQLGISTWVYRASSEGRHLGPVAEEFHRLFGLGSDGSSISTVDASGVALAAIQGLNQKLDAENAELRARLERLEKHLNPNTHGVQ